MENRFFEMDDFLSGSRKSRRRCGKRNGNGKGNGNSYLSSAQSFFATPFAAPDRALVVLIENGGVDLGLPELVDKVLSAIPGSGAIPDSARQKLVTHLREKIKGFTDNLLETLELSVNRYQGAKPEFYGEVSVLRDSTATLTDLQGKLIALSRAGKIIDLVILTHGSDDYISVTGGVNSEKIKAIKTEYGKPLSIRSVYMMNCVGSSLNAAWLAAGAKVSVGSLKNNYLPEPTTYFFWKAWKEGETFDKAAASAYRKTINLMNDVVRAFISALPIPGSSMLARLVDFANFDFVKDSAPVMKGQNGLTISSDDLTFAQTIVSSLSTTVIPDSALAMLSFSRSASERTAHALSPQGVDLIKNFEGFRDKLYNDPAGHCTVGYGTLVHRGNCEGHSTEQPYASGVTKERAAELLTQEAGGFAGTISNKVTVPLNQNQFDALVSFVYNVGPGAFEKSTLLKLLNQGKYDSIPTELKKWTKARQNGQVVDLPGLVKRRAAEADLFVKAEAVTAQSFSGDLGSGSGGYAFWAVWCYSEGCLLPEIFLQERAAQSAAQRHTELTTHQTRATEIRMGDNLGVQPADAQGVAKSASISYGQDTTLPDTNIQVVRGPEKFALPDHSVAMGNLVIRVTPPPEQGTQTHVGVLSVNITCVNESGTAVEMTAALLLRNSTERRSQILPGNFNGDFEFAWPNIPRNDQYSIVLSLNTVDSSIKVSGTFTVMMTDQR
jgi:GH24 family phage-related lysozyme (muramidase)